MRWKRGMGAELLQVDAGESSASALRKENLQLKTQVRRIPLPPTAPLPLLPPLFSPIHSPLPLAAGGVAEAARQRQTGERKG